MALKADIALPGALRERRVSALALCLLFDAHILNLDAVQPDPDARTLAADDIAIPLSRRPGRLRHGRHLVVDAARILCGLQVLVFGRAVIQDLDLHAGVRRVTLGRVADPHAAVSARPDLPFQTQFEVAVLAIGGEPAASPA